MSDAEASESSELTVALSQYSARLADALGGVSPASLEQLARDISAAWSAGRQVFICGNGGSAANAIHLANDLFYGIASGGGGLRVHALPANTAITTCLANDIGYDRIYADQLAVLADRGDVLLVLSGSGDSPNIVAALEQADRQGIRSHAIVGFDGGKALRLADNAIHVAIDDMQIAEDAQMAVGHALMQVLQGAGEPRAGAHG